MGQFAGLLWGEGTQAGQVLRQLPKAAPQGDRLELSQRPGKMSIPSEGEGEAT